MPYTPENERTPEVMAVPGTPGQLNWAITQTCLKYLERTEGRYADRAEIIGALESAKLEFYRRAVAPYEEKAIAKNGDLPGYAKENSTPANA